MTRAAQWADVLVVGGGPAGATAATLLAREGIGVLLVEKRPRGAGKVCGEFLSSEGVAVLERLGVLDALTRRGAMRVTDARIHPSSGEPFRVRLPGLAQGGGLGVSRSLLDETLLSGSAAAGVRVLRETRLTGLTRERNGWSAQVRRGSRTEIVRARQLLGADGRNSRVATLAGLGGVPTGWGLGIQIHLRRRDEPEPCVDLFLLKEGYAGLVGVEAERWCLGALLPPVPGDSDPFSRLTAAIFSRTGSPALRASPDPLDRCAAFPVATGWRGCGGPGWLLCGDAAGSVDPFSGQGIALALLGGEAAAECLRGILQGKERSSRRAYLAFLRREIGTRLSIMAPLRLLLDRPRLHEGFVGALRRYPLLGERLVGLTRNSGGPWLGALPRFAARLLMR
jgi:flavin-dependent dehydrogenase